MPFLSHLSLLPSCSDQLGVRGRWVPFPLAATEPQREKEAKAKPPRGAAGAQGAAAAGRGRPGRGWGCSGGDAERRRREKRRRRGELVGQPEVGGGGRRVLYHRSGEG